jgi:catechol 2,3-dioxygenase-like lactoylglutathione lyase family enzyme
MQVLINVDVDDLDKATHFYETAFGLKVGRRFGADGVEMLGSSAPIYLLVKAAALRSPALLPCVAVTVVIGRPFTSTLSSRKNQLSGKQ